VVEAVREQAGRLMHTSNLFYTEPMVRLARRLSESSLGGRVFFANSGTEANECAIKLARKHARARGVAEPQIVSFERDFHGRTYGGLSATPELAANPDFAPMLPGFAAVGRDDVDGLRAAVGAETAAVLIEPIQGEAGVYPVGEEMLAAARDACDRSGALLIFDEIQTGIGRTGSLWAYEQTPARPDVLTTAKALGGGMAIGACITAPAAAEVLGIGDHGSTFAGGPLAAAAALAVLDVVDDAALLRAVREVGARLRAGLAELDGVREVRGRGLMIGVGLETELDARRIADLALEGGLIVNVPEPGSLRLLPPLVIGDDEADEALAALREAIGRSQDQRATARSTTRRRLKR
jgi:acetylornithine/succinyldiaminopimelate/putrescine aminotransferase